MVRDGLFKGLWRNLIKYNRGCGENRRGRLIIIIISSTITDREKV